MLRLAFATGDRPPPGAGREVNAWRDRDGEVFARLFVDGRRHRIEWPRLGVFEFEAGSETVTLWTDPGASVEVSRDVFARAILPAALQALGQQALHASAVVVDGSALLLVGRSGSGKSTTAYALSRAGFPQIADDSVVFSTAGDRLRTIPLSFQPRLRAPSRQHFPRPVTPLTAPAAGIRLGWIAELQQQPQTPHREPLATLLPPAEAFSVVLAHAHSFDPGDREETLRLTQDYLRLANEVPVWRVTYAPGLDRLADLERALLQIAGGGAVASAMQ
jgi:hypothetical protein